MSYVTAHRAKFQAWLGEKWARKAPESNVNFLPDSRKCEARAREFFKVVLRRRQRKCDWYMPVGLLRWLCSARFERTEIITQKNCVNFAVMVVPRMGEFSSIYFVCYGYISLPSFSSSCVLS